MKRFVEIEEGIILSSLRDVGEKISQAGGSYTETTSGVEVVFDFNHHADSPAFVRVYTTLTVGAKTLRACDSDAVRIIIATIHKGKFYPLAKSRKLLRTAPNNIDERKRRQVFIDRLIGAIREAYPKIRKVPMCPECGSPMALREPKKNGKKFNPFFGCISYPTCKETLPVKN